MPLSFLDVKEGLASHAFLNGRPDQNMRVFAKQCEKMHIAGGVHHSPAHGRPGCSTGSDRPAGLLCDKFAQAHDIERDALHIRIDGKGPLEVLKRLFEIVETRVVLPKP